MGGRSFDHYARLVRRFLGVSAATVSLVEAERQLLPGAVGLAAPYAETRETPLSHSFCQHVVTSGEPLLIEDARGHPLVCDNLAIRDLQVVAQDDSVEILRLRSTRRQEVVARSES